MFKYLSFCSFYLSIVEEELVVLGRSPGNPVQMVQTAWCLVMVADCFDGWGISFCALILTVCCVKYVVLF